MTDRASQFPRTYFVAGGVWLVLFFVQFTFDSRAAAHDGNIRSLAITACIEIVLVASALAAVIVLLRRIPERGWSTSLSFAGWACAAALVLAAGHADSTAHAASSVGAGSLYVAAHWTRRLLQFLVAPVAILVVAYRSVTANRNQSRPLSLLFVSFGIMLLTWTWLTRPQSP
jgi:hypothetical protein